MISFILYALVGMFVLAYQARIRLAKLSAFNRENYSEKAWVPSAGIAVFWPVTLLGIGIWKVTNKVLDKVLKV